MKNNNLFFFGNLTKKQLINTKILNSGHIRGNKIITSQETRVTAERQEKRQSRTRLSMITDTDTNICTSTYTYQ